MDRQFPSFWRYPAQKMLWICLPPRERETERYIYIYTYIYIVYVCVRVIYIYRYSWIIKIHDGNRMKSLYQKPHPLWHWSLLKCCPGRCGLDFQVFSQRFSRFSQDAETSWDHAETFETDLHNISKNHMKFHRKLKLRLKTPSESLGSASLIFVPVKLGPTPLNLSGRYLSSSSSSSASIAGVVPTPTPDVDE